MIRHLAAMLVALATGPSPVYPQSSVVYDVVIRGGTVYDGSGGSPFTADVAVKGDRIAAIAPHLHGIGTVEVDARGKAVSPGFINMLAHPEDSLIADGRGLSDLAQGVTLEVMGELSIGPLTPEMKSLLVERQTDIQYPITWNTLGDYLDSLEKRGISPNIASFVSEGMVRINVLGLNDVEPSPDQLKEMENLVRQAMEEGSLGLTTALIYAPFTFAHTSEIADLATISAQCGGIYIAHIRNESSGLLESIQESVEIAKVSGAPAEIYHFKQAGRDNWDKLDAAVAKVEDARARGIRITADMYTYAASATGLDASMPAWVQEGGLDKWVERLKDPAIRTRVAAEMRDPHPQWDNALHNSGAEGVLLLGLKSDALKPLIGKTLAEVARARGTSPEETAMDLVAEDRSKVQVAYFELSEANVRREVALPWISFGSDGSAEAPEGVFLKSSVHPRAYGNFARLLGKYVRENHDLTMQEAIRRLTSFPAMTLSIARRGSLKPGYFADIVVFDPKVIADRATFTEPHQLAVGVEDVLVNGGFAFRNGAATGASTGRFVHGRAWTGQPGGGCRSSAADWLWSP